MENGSKYKKVSMGKFCKNCMTLNEGSLKPIGQRPKYCFYCGFLALFGKLGHKSSNLRLILALGTDWKLSGKSSLY